MVQYLSFALTLGLIIDVHSQSAHDCQFKFQRELESPDKCVQVKAFSKMMQCFIDSPDTPKENKSQYQELVRKHEIEIKKYCGGNGVGDNNGLLEEAADQEEARRQASIQQANALIDNSRRNINRRYAEKAEELNRFANKHKDHSIGSENSIFDNWNNNRKELEKSNAYVFKDISLDDTSFDIKNNEIVKIPTREHWASKNDLLFNSLDNVIEDLELSQRNLQEIWKVKRAEIGKTTESGSRGLMSGFQNQEAKGSSSKGSASKSWWSDESGSYGGLSNVIENLGISRGINPFNWGLIKGIDNMIGSAAYRTMGLLDQFSKSYRDLDFKNMEASANSVFSNLLPDFIKGFSNSK